MKYSFAGKFVVATAESVQDSMALIALAQHTEKPTVRTRQKRSHLKPCPICGEKFFKVNLHITKKHPHEMEETQPIQPIV